jgi:hypothetical protein
MRKEFYILIVLIVLTMFVFGCKAKTDASTDTKTGDNVAGQQTNNVATNDDTKTGTGSSLSDILKGKTVKYTADYQITTKGVTSSLTYVMSLPDFAIITNTAEGESRMIFKDSTTYACNNAEGSWACLELSSLESNANEKLENDVKEGTAKPVYVGTCTRAGLTGEKYSVTAEGVTSTVCYTKKGILLETESPDSTMYATKVSESIDASLLTLPAEPQDFSSMIPGGIPNIG